MSPEQQRIAIAEACGYERLTHFEAVWRNRGSKIYTPMNLPNYPADLNAMHEAEKFIRNDHDVYGLYLSHLNRTAPECRVHATAAQRAEAFLRTVGKWEESP
jgi:hypothetical protein